MRGGALAAQFAQKLLACLGMPLPGRLLPRPGAAPGAVRTEKGTGTAELSVESLRLTWARPPGAARRGLGHNLRGMREAADGAPVSRGPWKVQ